MVTVESLACAVTDAQAKKLKLMTSRARCAHLVGNVFDDKMSHEQ